MAPHLLLADADSATDAMTFAVRAEKVGDGAVRLRAEGGVLVMSCAALAPRGILDRTPTILALRTVAADPELVCDLVVPADALRAEGAALALPTSALRAAWAGVSPPRSGWSFARELPAAVLIRVADDGIAEVAGALPDGAGDDIVQQVRSAIWGSRSDELGDLPRGAAFAARALGFLVDPVEAVRVFSSGGWDRLTCHRGHVLVRAGRRSAHPD